MGENESKATVLECMIKNFKKGFGRDYGVKMTPNFLHILCEVEWPSMGIGWPPEGTMNLKIVEAVYTVVTGKPGYPDQFPYIDSWLGLAQDLPSLDEILYQERERTNMNGTKMIKNKFFRIWLGMPCPLSHTGSLRGHQPVLHQDQWPP